MNNEMIKRRIKEKYNLEFEKYDNNFKSKAGKHFIKRKIEQAVSFKVIREREKVLEVGSATGIFSFEYEKLNIQLISIDLAYMNINYAKYKKKLKDSKIDFRVGDVEDLEFDDNTFDGVLSFSTLRYVPNIKKALSEIYRVLKPGGYIILDFPNKNCPWFGSLKKYVLGREHIHDNHYLNKEIENLLFDTGFININIKQGLFIPKSTPNRLFSLFRMFEFLAEKIPMINNYSAIIFCNASKK